MTIGIYIWTNNINQKKYVGQSNNCESRCYKHEKNKGNKPLYNAFKKYGKKNFSLEIIECPLEHLDMWERFYIHYYDTFGKNGYNLTEGGGGLRGVKRGPMCEDQRTTLSKRLIEFHKTKTPEWQEECSKKLKEAFAKRTPEQIIEIYRKISITAKLNGKNLNKIVSDETKAKISQSLTGHKDSEETILKKSGRIPHNKGIPASEETKNKISKNSARRGQPGTMLGQKHSTEARQKITETNLGTHHYNNGIRTIRIDPSSELIPTGFVEGRLMKSQRPFLICGQRFVSIIEAAKTLGINKNTIFGRLQSVINTDYVYE